MHGLVYRDAYQNLLLVTPDGRVTPVNDQENYYSELPPELAEVCEVDLNEATNIVVLRAIAGMQVENNGQPCPAYHAIEYALKNKPQALYDAIEHYATQGRT